MIFMSGWGLVAFIVQIFVFEHVVDLLDWDSWLILLYFLEGVLAISCEGEGAGWFFGGVGRVVAGVVWLEEFFVDGVGMLNLGWGLHEKALNMG